MQNPCRPRSGRGGFRGGAPPRNSTSSGGAHWDSSARPAFDLSLLTATGDNAPAPAVARRRRITLLLRMQLSSTSHRVAVVRTAQIAVEATDLAAPWTLPWTTSTLCPPFMCWTPLTIMAPTRTKMARLTMLRFLRTASQLGCQSLERSWSSNSAQDRRSQIWAETKFTPAPSSAQPPSSAPGHWLLARVPDASLPSLLQLICLIMESNAQGSALKALIVEDNAVCRLLLRKILGRFYCETIVAKNGQEAVDMFLQGEKFDIVFMDKDMPIMYGPKAVEMIRAMGETDVKIVGVSADDNAMEAFMSVGADEFMPKPVKPEIIGPMIQEVINKKNAMV